MRYIDNNFIKVKFPWLKLVPKHSVSWKDQSGHITPSFFSGADLAERATGFNLIWFYSHHHFWFLHSSGDNFTSKKPKEKTFNCAKIIYRHWSSNWEMGLFWLRMWPRTEIRRKEKPPRASLKWVVFKYQPSAPAHQGLTQVVQICLLVKY